MASVPSRLIRRTISIPALTVALPLALVLTVVVVPILAVVDQLQGHRHFRLARVWLLAVGAAAVEFGGMVGGALLWLRFGLVRRVDSEASMAAHSRLQIWWAGAQLRNFRRFAGLRLVIDDPELTHKGNAVVVARHASHADAVLPAWIYGGPGGLRVRYTLKDTLQWAPAIDLTANRLPNVFVDRAPAPDSPVLEQIEELARGCDHGNVCVIFPEGTFFTPERLDRAADRLGSTRADLEATARRLRYMLPPRPAGTLALLRGAPDADVVFIGHVGIEAFGSLKEITANIPVADPLRIRIWRCDRSTVPDNDHDRVTWLLDRWIEVDEWIATQVENRARGDALAPDVDGSEPDEIVA